MLIVPQPHFVGAPTTEAERKVLQNAGYIHMTGLWFLTRDGNRSAHGCYMGEGLTPELCGTWNDIDRESVIVTERGEVWMKTGSHVKSATDLLCPKGRSNYTPFKPEDGRPVDGMIRRMADPNDGLNYLY